MGTPDSPQRHTELQIDRSWGVIASELRSPTRSLQSLTDAIMTFPFQEARSLAAENRVLRSAYDNVITGSRQAAKKGGGSPMKVSICEMIEDEDGSTQILLISALGDQKDDDSETVKKMVSMIVSKITTEQNLLNLAYAEVLTLCADIIEPLVGNSPHPAIRQILSLLRSGDIAKILSSASIAQTEVALDEAPLREEEPDSRS